MKFQIALGEGSLINNFLVLNLRFTFPYKYRVIRKIFPVCYRSRDFHFSLALAGLFSLRIARIYI